MKKFLSIMFIITVIVSIVNVNAEEYETRCWVLCQPDSYVNVREYAYKRASESGIMECGDVSYTDEKSKNGYLHLISLPNETGDGWISKGYVVFTEPVRIMKSVNICAEGRVACWRCIGGRRRCWVTNNDCVVVYYASEEWSVTDYGFIRTKYLGIDYEAMLNMPEIEDAEMTWEDE